MRLLSRDVDAAGRRRLARVRAALGWLAVNALLGYLLAWPLAFGALYISYRREDSHRDEREISGTIAVVGCALLLAVWAVANRVLVWRLHLVPWHAAVVWVAALVIQATPFAWFMLATDQSVGALLFFG